MGNEQTKPIGLSRTQITKPEAVDCDEYWDLLRTVSVRWR
jgi:hypothetical protein